MNIHLFRKLKLNLLVFALSALGLVGIFFVRNFNSPENVEKRCTFKFQKDLKKGVGMPDNEWHLNMDLADYNYLKCMRIP